ncbi:GerMN domain-containing protein [Sellimonas sp.]|uniref:GerMN domain-containing protein n=1 Tax=Sellimonas sp. TaxID=2021466 RepID=UPI00257EDEB6|nr:GerMN domain-containing protein [Sellimonas sp.]
MKRVLAVMLTVLLAAGLLFGCGRGDRVKKNGFGLYYLNRDKTELVKVPYEIQSEEMEEQISEVLGKLVSPDADAEDYYTPFKKGVKIEQAVIDGKQVQVHFNKKYSSLKSSDEVLLRASVVKTLVQISGVSYVSFFVGDEPLMGADNNPIGLMRGEDFVQNIGSSLHSYETVTLTLYFANKNGDKLVEETVSNVRYNTNISMDRLILEQLLKGPASSDAYPTVPQNVKILSVSTKDQVCYVNFDKELLNVKTNVKPEVLIYSIVNSITAGGSTSQVQISINGESNINFGESVKLDKPLSRNLDIVEGEEKE